MLDWWSADSSHLCNKNGLSHHPDGLGRLRTLLEGLKGAVASDHNLELGCFPQSLVRKSIPQTCRESLHQWIPILVSYMQFPSSPMRCFAKQAFALVCSLLSQFHSLAPQDTYF